MEDWERALEEQLRRDRLRQQALQFASPELKADIESTNANSAKHGKPQ
jgi:hypothetical protein